MDHEAQMKQALKIYQEQVWEEADMDNLEEAFEGVFDFHHHINEHLFEQWVECMELPDHIPEYYLDKDAISRDMMYDYSVCEEDGKFYLFRSI